MGNELESTGMQFLQLIGALKLKFARDLTRYGVTFPQFMVLMALEKAQQSCRMGPLASFTLQSLPAVTGIVDRLEERGLVQRQRDPHDRRSVVVCLTEKGKTLLSQIKAERQQTLEEIFKVLTPEERAFLNSVLEKLTRVLETPEQGGSGC